MKTPRMIRVAVDVQFGLANANDLQGCGIDVVVRAHPGESDRDWFARAMAARADVICSPDTDLEILAYDRNIPFVRLPGNSRLSMTAVIHDIRAAAESVR